MVLSKYGFHAECENCILNVCVCVLQECGGAGEENLPWQPGGQHSGDRQRHLRWPDSRQHPQHLRRRLCHPEKHDQYHGWVTTGI